MSAGKGWAPHVLGAAEKGNPVLDRQTSGSHACETMGSSEEKALGSGRLGRREGMEIWKAYGPGGQLSSGDVFREVVLFLCMEGFQASQDNIPRPGFTAGLILL